MDRWYSTTPAWWFGTEAALGSGGPQDLSLALSSLLCESNGSGNTPTVSASSPGLASNHGEGGGAGRSLIGIHSTFCHPVSRWWFALPWTFYNLPQISNLIYLWNFGIVSTNCKLHLFSRACFVLCFNICLYFQLSCGLYSKIWQSKTIDFIRFHGKLRLVSYIGTILCKET